MNAAPALWFNYWHPPYRGNEPAFYDQKDFSWMQELLSDWHLYEIELMDLLNEKKKQMRPYFASERDTGDSGWKTIALKTWGINVSANLDRCPKLKKLIESHPGWLSASVNVLEAGTSIKEHSGDTNAIFRCHVGIDIPASLPICGLRVNNEEREWKKGQALIFPDAYPHSAWNNSESERIIFLFDYLRPEFSSRNQYVCIRVRAFLLLQLAAEKFRPLKNTPKFFQKLIYHALRILLKILLPYQKKKGVIINH